MSITTWLGLPVAAAAAFAIPAAGAADPKLPDAIAAQNETVVFQVHAEGMMIYECRDEAGDFQCEPFAAEFVFLRKNP